MALPADNITPAAKTRPVSRLVQSKLDRAQMVADSMSIPIVIVTGGRDTVFGPVYLRNLVGNRDSPYAFEHMDTADRINHQHIFELVDGTVTFMSPHAQNVVAEQERLIEIFIDILDGLEMMVSNDASRTRRAFVITDPSGHCVADCLGAMLADFLNSINPMKPSGETYRLYNAKHWSWYGLAFPTQVEKMMEDMAAWLALPHTLEPSKDRSSDRFFGHLHSTIELVVIVHK